MNWLQKISQRKMKDLGDEELETLRIQGNEAISYLVDLTKKFPKAHFQTTLRQLDMVQNHGPKIAFMMFYEDIGDDDKKEEDSFLSILNLPSSFYDYAEITTASGVKIEGYMKRSGYDENVYRWLNGEWVGFNNNDWPWGNFESGQNLVKLIKWNLLYLGTSTELAWRKYSKDPQIKGILESIDQYDVAVKDGIQMLLEAMPPNKDVDAFINGYKNWWWSRKSREEFVETLQKTIGDVQEDTNKNPDQYVYNISMDPRTESNGKYIDWDLIEQAFEMYGEFNVLVQYHAARITYPASEIINYRKTNDDRSFNFFNQNGGIRQMWVTK